MSTVISHTKDHKTHALVAYLLMTVGLFTAIPVLIGAIWAMFTRGGTQGSVYYSHYTNAIRVFWWSLFWAIIGWLTTFIIIGFAVLGIAWLWALYRLVYGLVKIVANEPYPL